jgi:pimeloyl-ACP methyl ester carboxylesterase
MPVVEIDRIPVAYEVIGEGLPVLLVHGWQGDHRYMAADLERVFEAVGGWRRVYVDLPGHGRTPAPGWLAGQAQMLAVLQGFVDAVFARERYAVAGSSYGGYLSLALVRSMPERLRGAALLVPDLPAADGSRDVPPRVTIIEDRAVASGLDGDEAWIPGVLVEQSLLAVQEIRDHEMPAIRAADRRFLARLEADYLLPATVATPGRPFERPSLILTGRQDATVGYRAAWGLLDEFPRATYAALDLAGHWLGRAERPDAFGALVRDWLERVALDGSPEG